MLVEQNENGFIAAQTPSNEVTSRVVCWSRNAELALLEELS